MRACAIVLSCFSFVCCTAVAPVFEPPTGETVTVFVHGYNGSFLETNDPEHSRAWLSPGDVMSRGNRSLALPYEGQRTPPAFPKLVSAGPLTRLTAFPLLASQDVYLGWMEFGRSELKGFVPFSYDWRQDVIVSGKALCEFLSKLPARKIQIVAHSMGGLVTWSCLAEDPDVAARVNKIVFVGTPFRGCVGIFDDLLRGTPVGRNRSLLSREALFTFPATWQLLPTHSGFFVDRVGAPVPLDAFSVDEWVNRHWGMFETDASPADRAQLQRQLEHHARLHALLARPLLSSPAVMAVIGSGHPTVSAVRVLGQAFDFDDSPTDDGDGSVLVSSATPPIPFTLLTTHAEHVALLNDKEVQKAIALFLVAL
jgi:pimeloyl-ACP methyl ester carboxylesterase